MMGGCCIACSQVLLFYVIKLYLKHLYVLTCTQYRSKYNIDQQKWHPTIQFSSDWETRYTPLRLQLVYTFWTRWTLAKP
jgi:hypothetical protein